MSDLSESTDAKRLSGSLDIEDRNTPTHAHCPHHLLRLRDLLFIQRSADRSAQCEKRVDSGEEPHHRQNTHSFLARKREKQERIANTQLVQ